MDRAPEAGARLQPQLAERARVLVSRLGGRFSTELGIDVDAGGAQVARWFLASTLFGNRISATVAAQTFRTLDGAGVTAAGARHVGWDTLVELLDAGGYTRYDFRTATRLMDLSDALDARYGGDVNTIASSVSTPDALAAALDALPGWGPVTVGIFLRELRGVWALAAPPLSDRVLWAGRHLGFFWFRAPEPRLVTVAGASGLDRRDLECALERLASGHRRRAGSCPGGDHCLLLAPSRKPAGLARPA